jgi:hypothetical protein
MADALWTNSVGGVPAYTANELRQAMALAVMYAGRNMGGRAGVRPGGNQLSVSLAGSTITVQPGVAYVDPGLSVPQGGYWVALPGAENPTGGPLAAADATNPRKDIVVLRVYDDDEDSSGLRLARSEYIAGVANPSPSAPAVPAGAMRLATIDVPASPGAPVVTVDCPYTVAAGGLLPVRTQAERDALNAVAYDGLGVWRRDLKRIQVWDAAAWRTCAVESTAVSVEAEQLTDGTTASATFTATLTGSTTPGLTFVAANSGKAFVNWFAQQTSDASNSVFSTFELRAGGVIGSGTVIVAASDDNALWTDPSDPNQNIVSGMVRKLVPGLTPGSTYNVRGMYRSGGGNANFRTMRISVEPTV